MNSRFPLQTLWLLLLSTGLLAQQPGEIPRHERIDAFPEALLREAETVENVNYRVVLGSLQSIRGQIVAEASQRVRGDLTRLLFEIPAGFSGEEVYQFFREQMSERGYRELFTCSGRACGSSEYWANDIFGKRILYGPVLGQFYLAMGSNPPGEFHVSAYVITRANRQLLAYLAIVEVDGAAPSDASAPDALLAKLRISRSAAVAPALEFGADDRLAPGAAAQAGLQEWIELLGREPELRLHVVVHLQGEGELEELLARSAVRAEAVRQALVEAGIEAGRLDSHGLGPLAPSCLAGDCAARVEFVLLSTQQ